MTPLSKSVHRVRRLLKTHPEWYDALRASQCMTPNAMTYSAHFFEEMFYYEYQRYPTCASDPLWDEFLHVYRFQTALRVALQLELESWRPTGRHYLLPLSEYSREILPSK